MSRINLINPESAAGSSLTLLNKVKSALGIVPNMTRAMAVSPAVLEGYLSFSSALTSASLSASQREGIALFVAELNRCSYCLAAHTAIAGLVKVPSDEILTSRKGISTDAKTQAILEFSGAIVEKRGRISQADYEAALSSGLSEAEITEVIAVVALNVFTNYFNIALEVDVDFPAAPSL